MRLNALVGCPVLVIVAALAVAAAPAGAAQTSRTYHVGNSLTAQGIGSDTDGLSNLAAARGITHTYGYHVQGGQGLGYITATPQDANTFFSPSIYPTALPNNAWDIVTIQTYGDTYDVNKNAIKQLVNLTRNNPANQNTKFFVYEGWPQDYSSASGPNYSDHWLSTYDPSQPADPTNRLKTWSRGFSDQLMSDLRSASFASPSTIYRVRTGEVFYRLDLLADAGQLGTTTGIEQWYMDPYHMGEFGKYAAQLTMFSTLYGENPTGLPKPAAMSPEVAAIVQQTVWDVVSNDPYGTVATPEPSGVALLGVGALALLRRSRRARAA